MVKISVCMIVKNEEKNLKRCLESIKTLADEIIIVDTGSTDNTKLIASQYTDKVSDFTWNDDFSAARNESLKGASGDWIMVIDADETIASQDHMQIKNLLNKTPETVDGYMIIQRNYIKDKKDIGIEKKNDMDFNTVQDDKGLVSADCDAYKESLDFVGWLPSPIMRIFRNREGVKFTGVVHEDVSPSLKGQIKDTKIPVHHFDRMDVVKWKKKNKFYEKLGEEKAMSSDDYYAYFELGQKYLASGKVDKAEEMFLRSVELDKKYWGSWFNLGTIKLMQKDEVCAEDYLKKAKELNPGAAPVYMNLGALYFKKEDYKKAIQEFLRAAKLNPKDPSVFKNLGSAYAKDNDLRDAILCYLEAIKINPKDAKAYREMGMCFDRGRQFEHARKAFEKAIELDPKMKDQIKLN